MAVKEEKRKKLRHSSLSFLCHEKPLLAAQSVLIFVTRDVSHNLTSSPSGFRIQFNSDITNFRRATLFARFIKRNSQVSKAPY